MIFEFLYRIGRFMSLRCPIKLSYRVAVILADLHYMLYCKERRAVMENLRVIFNRPADSTDKDLKKIARDVFRNFARYLVDFLRFSRIDLDYIKKYVVLKGVDNLEESLKRGKGVILLSAHLGNWELGGYVMGKLGYPINAVVLSHKNEKVNQFFIDQRGMGNFKSIEIGASLRGCYKTLKGNELLALLGDRNFSSTGIMMDFFNKPALMPKGPPALSIRTGAAIVPTYFIREKDDSFTMIFEKPIYPAPAVDEEAAARDLMKQYLASIENMIRQYPGQWYVFREFWGHA
ncbi:MAG: lysophospholipid acyltransferase family protein [Candidatus Omnitrophota bacterium]